MEINIPDFRSLSGVDVVYIVDLNHLQPSSVEQKKIEISKELDRALTQIVDHIDAVATLRFLQPHQIAIMVRL